MFQRIINIIMSGRTSSSNKSAKSDIIATECYNCNKNGESVYVYTGHNFRDPKGRIVCSAFFKKSGGNSQFAKEGNVFMNIKKAITRMNKTLELHSNEKIKKSEPKTGFDVLAEDSSDEEFEKLYPHVTVRSKLALQMPKSWADFSDSDEE